MEKNIKYYLNILLVSIFAITFINVFFFTYGVTVEHEIIKTNVDYIADNMKTLIKQLPPQYQASIKEKIDKTQLNNTIEEDEIIDSQNTILLRNSMIITGVLLVLSICSIIISYKYFEMTREDILEVLGSSFILVGGLALVEFLFLILVIKNYMLADMNKINIIK